MGRFYYAKKGRDNLSYKIFSDKPEYTKAFLDFVLTPLQNAGVDTEKALDGLSFYFGINPTSAGVNTNRDHYDPNKRNIVKPNITILPGIDLQRQLRAIFQIVVHEIGHDIHFQYLKQDSTKWATWAKITNNKVDLTWQKLGNTGYEYAPSYETFANDFQACITPANFELSVEETNKRRKYYYSLWGQTYTPQQIVELWIDKKEYMIDGQKKYFNVAPMIKDGRTMLELRDLLVSVMGVKPENIQWDDKYKKVTFIK